MARHTIIPDPFVQVLETLPGFHDLTAGFSLCPECERCERSVVYLTPDERRSAEAAGMRPLVTVSQAATELGLSPETPLLGYVTTGEFLREHGDLVKGLAAASRQAKDLLATDEAAWEELRPIMNAKSDAQFAALKAGFRAGIPAPGPVDEQAAGAMLALMANLGGEELMGKVTTLPEGVFVQPGS